MRHAESSLFKSCLFKSCLSLAIVLALSTGPALAEDEPPVLDVDKTCASSGRAGVTTGDKATVEGCLRAEQAARGELKKRWNEFSPDAKSQCSKQSQAGGFPSYVETVTCLELATGVAPKPSGDGAAPKPKDSRGSRLTDEPSPKQRTNPIDVLERK